MPETTTKSADVLRVESYWEWHGHLTLDNAEAVHARIVGLLGGDKLHATAHYMADDHRPPRLRTGMEARVELRRPTVEDPYAVITIADHAGVVFLATKTADGAAAREMPPADRPPWLKLTHDRLEVSDHVPAGTAAYTVYAVEEGRDA